MGLLKLKVTVILFTCLAITSTTKQNERNQQKFLTQQFFQKMILEVDIYKFVTFIKSDCRFSGLIKQIEKQLQQQRDWSFRLYTVDCSSEIKMCQKLGIVTWPYMALYNGQGIKNGQIGGYYPINIMRDAYELIQKRIKNKITEGENKIIKTMPKQTNYTKFTSKGGRNSIQNKSIYPYKYLNQINMQKGKSKEQQKDIQLQVFQRIKMIGLLIILVIAISLFKNIYFSVNQVQLIKTNIFKIPFLNYQLNAQPNKNLANYNNIEYSVALAQNKL